MERPTAFPGAPAMPTTVFAVVGEHRDDPDHLLVLGADGQHYDLHLPDGVTLPVEPDEEWRVDPSHPDTDEVAG